MTERDNREAEAAGIDKNGSFLTDEPLIAEENGDVLYFDSAQFASEYIEAIDVGNGEYRFYDTNGERVVPRVSENPRAIRFERSGVPVGLPPFPARPAAWRGVAPRHAAERPSETMTEPDNRNGMDSRMKKRRKWLIAAVLIVAGGALFPHMKLYADFRRGEAVAMSREGEIEIVVDGRRSKAPCYCLDATALSPRLRPLRAFELDSNLRKTVVAPRDPALGGALFWLAEAKIGVTRCSPLFDVSRLGSRRMLVSETALNCTYDVQDDMKGLAAVIEIGLDATNRSYRCRFERDGRPVEVEFLVPGPPAEGQRL